MIGLVRNGRARHRGFTLLEVMLALTICAFALAALFRVVAGSKQLTYRAQNALQETVELRHLLNLPLLVDETGELLVPLDESGYRINLVADEIEIPERKTAETTETLYEYEVEDADGRVMLRGSYWVTLELEE